MRNPNFQRRHYEALARVIQDQDAKWFGNNLQIADTAYALANMLQKDNPRFDRERFIAACQPGADVAKRKPRIPVSNRKEAA